MQEWRDESEIYNFQWIQLSNNKFVNYEILGGGGEGGAWPGMTVTHVPWVEWPLMCFVQVENVSPSNSTYPLTYN